MEKKTHLFKAEVGEMLDLVINSLYSKKEIFLRELLSNASDAIDRAKYRGLTEKELVADNPEWKITITADKDAKTLMVSDNGSGMNAEGTPRTSRRTSESSPPPARRRSARRSRRTAARTSPSSSGSSA